MKRHLKAVSWQFAKFSESKEEIATGTFLTSSSFHTSFSISSLLYFVGEIILKKSS